MTSKLLRALADNRILVFNGRPGSGKSLLAKEITKERRKILIDGRRLNYIDVHRLIDDIKVDNQILIVEDIINLTVFEIFVLNGYPKIIDKKLILILVIDANLAEFSISPSFSRKIKVVNIDA